MQNNQRRNPEFLERWAAAYTLVTSIPDDQRFNMYTWGKKDTESACGTAACLAGHAVLHPWFMERGFYLKETSIRRDGAEAVCFDLGSCYHEAHKFWGLDNMGNCPFDPDFCERQLNRLGNDEDDEDDAYYEEEEALTSSEVAIVVEGWMIDTWGKEATAAAIAASTVVYSLDAVHANAPWNQVTK